MSDQNTLNYQRIAVAIDFINKNFKEQPKLDTVAESIGMSPFHFQRLFTEWAGVSPKKFMQYLSIEYAKGVLRDGQSSVLNAALETGLSGAGRLHDLFVTIEGMTPGEYKIGGESLRINYCFAESSFGNLIIASTTKGVCHMFFNEDEASAVADLKKRFPNADYKQRVDQYHRDALFVVQNNRKDGKQIKLDQIKLHLRGTDFQLKVWEALLKIPAGQLTTYGDLAAGIDQPKAARAVGTAIGSNPVAFLIPCHRVIQASGNFGGYMWGSTRKHAIIGWEASRAGA